MATQNMQQKKQKPKKSAAKEQSMRDYAGMITTYAVIISIVLFIYIYKFGFLDLNKLMSELQVIVKETGEKLF